jgi:hypothetical protein
MAVIALAFRGITTFSTGPHVVFHRVWQHTANKCGCTSVAGGEPCCSSCPLSAVSFIDCDGRRRSCLVCGSCSMFWPVVQLVRCFSCLFGVLKLALGDCAFYGAYIPNATSMPGLCCSYGCFYGLHYVVFFYVRTMQLPVLAFYFTSMLVSTMYLWATICGLSLPVTNSIPSIHRRMMGRYASALHENAVFLLHQSLNKQ